MESSFWSGVKLENFMFNEINIKSYSEFILVCFITVAIAFAFEGSRTLRDWMYVEFLKKRSCHRTSNDAVILLRDVKPSSQTNGQTSSTSLNGERANNGQSSTESSNVSANDTATVPVIATGTIQGSGKGCDKPISVCVGLLELSFSTLLHMFQVILGYILMLMVMTFNVWIFAAVLGGTSVGFFIFDNFNKKIHALKTGTSTSESK